MATVVKGDENADRILLLTSAKIITESNARKTAKNVLFVSSQNGFVDCRVDSTACLVPSFAVLEENWIVNYRKENNFDENNLFVYNWNWGFYVVDRESTDFDVTTGKELDFSNWTDAAACGFVAGAHKEDINDSTESPSLYYCNDVNGPIVDENKTTFDCGLLGYAGGAPVSVSATCAETPVNNILTSKVVGVFSAWESFKFVHATPLFRNLAECGMLKAESTPFPSSMELYIVSKSECDDLGAPEVPSESPSASPSSDGTPELCPDAGESCKNNGDCCSGLCVGSPRDGKTCAA